MVKTNLLYKYTAVNANTLKNLLLSEMWFNPPDLMNDQLEGLVKVKNIDFKPGKRALERFIAVNNLTEFYFEPKKTIEKLGFLDFYMTYWFGTELNKYKVSSFSTTPTESLMWAHYADKHAGMCLIYDRSKLMRSLLTVDSTFQILPISYGKRPTITLVEEKELIKYTSDIPIISAKDSNWKYEKEVRVFKKETWDHATGGTSIYIENSCLKGIIYGYQMSESDKDAVSIILRNEPHYTSVKEYEEVIDFKTGKISIEPD